MRKLQLHWQILIAFICAIILGFITRAIGAANPGLAETLLQGYNFVGTLFINALKMLIVPLIFFSIGAGVANTGGQHFGRLGGKTLLYYVCTSGLAALIGVLMVAIVQPGIVNGQPAREMLGLDQQELGATFEERIEGRSFADLKDVFISMVPPNVVKAAAEGQMLGLIFFSILLGFFSTRLEKQHSEFLRTFLDSMFQLMMQITHWVMMFAPLGVLALVARVIAETGFDTFIPLAKFLTAVFGGLLLHMFVLMPLVLVFVARVNPIRHYQAMAPAMLTAFSTSSSAATLPVTMDCVENRAGISNRVTSFVLPMGATVNMDGTALFEVVAVLFLVQAYGEPLTFVTMISVAILALVTSIGVAAVPSASLVAIVLILGNFGIPASAAALILAIDRLPDMTRTVNNIFGDSVGAVVIAKSEGEDIYGSGSSAPA
ncbi:MAG: dicarboxylate/amino acid:cation symporter [Planctomycetales bacterium]|nr:dicarboxylate/amino acid:cation symporter [bacterium]UNM08973.1 MAG: dicarboxylate/amino acid:cation symporter [Planctomycetales bacterium]